MTVSFTAFGETRELPVIVFKQGQLVYSDYWDFELWVDHPEDIPSMFEEINPDRYVRIILRNMWEEAKQTN